MKILNMFEILGILGIHSIHGYHATDIPYRHIYLIDLLVGHLWSGYQMGSSIGLGKFYSPPQKIDIIFLINKTVDMIKYF